MSREALIKQILKANDFNIFISGIELLRENDSDFNNKTELIFNDLFGTKSEIPRDGTLLILTQSDIFI